MCPPGWVIANITRGQTGSQVCLRITHGAASWDDARRHCSEELALLVNLESDTVQLAINGSSENLQEYLYRNSTYLNVMKLYTYWSPPFGYSPMTINERIH
jgi:hypothetical protein